MQQLSLALAPPPAPTFDSFFPAANAAVVAQLKAAAQGQGKETFLYLWGPAGSGKTHLLRAFVAACGASATAHYVAAGDGNRCEGPVLACDDVQRLDLLEQTELFELCVRLRAAGGTLLAAGDRPPAQLPLREDLRTRLGAGVVLRALPLTDEEKKAALSEHARRRGIVLAADWLDFLLARVARDMGTQMAVIDTADRLSLERKRPVTLALLREVAQLAQPKP